MICVTATCTQEVRHDIETNLGLRLALVRRRRGEVRGAQAQLVEADFDIFNVGISKRSGLPEAVARAFELVVHFVGGCMTAFGSFACSGARMRRIARTIMSGAPLCA